LPPDKPKDEKGKKSHSTKQKNHDEESHSSKGHKKKSSKGKTKEKQDSEEEKHQFENRMEQWFHKQSAKIVGTKTKIGASQDPQQEQFQDSIVKLHADIEGLHLND